MVPISDSGFNALPPSVRAFARTLLVTQKEGLEDQGEVKELEGIPVAVLRSPGTGPYKALKGFIRPFRAL